jgi:hypothetical protein
MADFNVKDEYAKLKKKFTKLPDFEVLDFEFEIGAIEKTGFVMRKIEERMFERLDPVMENIQNILQPDPGSFVCMYECTLFSAAEKEKLLDIYKSLMILKKSLQEASLTLEDSADVDVICIVAEKWPLLRKQALPFVKKLREEWKTKTETKEILEYLG